MQNDYSTIERENRPAPADLMRNLAEGCKRAGLKPPRPDLTYSQAVEFSDALKKRGMQ